MKGKITKETLTNLLKLSRIEFSFDDREKKEAKLLEDLEKILDYVEELKTVNTDHISLVQGGRTGVSGYRIDKEKNDFLKELSTSQFPEVEKGYLKVPATLVHKKEGKQK